MTPRKPATAHIYGAKTRLSSAYTRGVDGLPCAPHDSEKSSKAYQAWLTGKAEREEFAARDRDNKPGGRDRRGHSSLQPWSQGDVFPAVIHRCERYTDAGRECEYSHPLSSRLRTVSYVLTLDGHEEEYASYDDAREVAVALIASPFLRAQWQSDEAN